VYRMIYLVPLSMAGVIGWAASAARPDLTGHWLVDRSLSRLHSNPPGDLACTIEQKDDDTIHFTETSSTKGGKFDFACTTRGQDCEVKKEDKAVKVSFWYNGPALVETETRGRNAEVVTKKRMLL
jgi:hypothetical protein